MRISPVGFAFKMPDAMTESDKATGCTHNHPEGIKGARATVSCIRCLLDGGSKENVKTILQNLYGEDYTSRLPEKGAFDETCQGTVPLAIHLFLESDGFEDAIRRAVAFGGDSDTLAAIVGSMAEACYGVPKEIWHRAESFLTNEMKAVVSTFYEKY